ncbi:cation:proton antiporter [Candidatus Roizmanbacteria bacterium]|nr:cation:proton antiporter [Candidatus Roizmanbacteria bacterium]
MEIFTEVAIIIALATIVSMVMRFLRQPLVVGYILTGIIVGPYVLNVLHSTEYVELFSKIGITVLLFIMGLNLSPRVIKDLGKVSVIAGVGQVLLTSLIGFGIALLLGMDRIAALYISIALTFSSTIVVLKLLSDRGDLNKLYGKIAIGLLLVQDVIATLILLFVSSLSSSTNTNIVLLALFLLVKMLIALCFLFLISSLVIPRLAKFVAKSQELLFLFSLSWGLGLSTIFYQVGFSIEIGALIAGVMLSLTPYAYEIGSRLKPLRDFFIVLFFILLGSQMVLDEVQGLVFPAVLLSLFVLIGNPVIVIVLMNLLGFKKRTGFMAGLTVAQISEFSLILAALGFSIGHISRDTLSLITLIGLITITGSTYFILYADRIYVRVQHLLKNLQLIPEKKYEPGGEEDHYDTMLFGYDRVGADFVRIFKKLKASYVVVDYNPSSIQRLTEEHIPYRYGDAEDVEFLEELHLDKVKLALSTIPDHKTNRLLTRKLYQANNRAVIVVLAETVKQAKSLYDEGATYVIMPHYLGARYAMHMISEFGQEKKFYLNEKEKHLKHIQKRIQK